jgi:hypothetical protein
VVRRRGRRGKQLLDDLKETKGHWKLNKEGRDRILWRTRSGRGYGQVVRQTTELTCEDGKSPEVNELTFPSLALN